MTISRITFALFFVMTCSAGTVSAQAASTPAPASVPAAAPSTLPAAAKSVVTPDPLLATAIPSPMPSAFVLHVTDTELRVPEAALAAARKTIGGSTWNSFGGVFVSGITQVQNQSLPFTYSANLKTGYNRTIVLLPRNAGTYEYGVDKTGGWTASGGVVRQVAATSHNLKTALYVNRFGFLNFPSDAASLKEIGVDAELGDRIGITPAGATAILAVIKPSTSLVSAIQFANGQVNVFADYRPISGVLFPFRTMQGANVNSLSVFQATAVELVAKEPDIAAVTRPKLTAYAAPDARALEKPFTPKEKKN